jgi:nitrite reductase (NADH) small subunit
MTLLQEPVPGDVLLRESTEVDVCAFDDLVPDRGVCALVGAVPVAVFRVSAHPSGGEGEAGDELYAVGNVDPFSGASVLSRGIVGSIGDRPVVASPLYKNRFDLRTGESLDDPAVRLPVHAARIADGRVLVGTATARPAPG